MALAQTEARVHHLETSYFVETGAFNVVRGWEGFKRAPLAIRKVEGSTRAADRVLSLSSLTSPAGEVRAWPDERDMLDATAPPEAPLVRAPRPPAATAYGGAGLGGDVSPRGLDSGGELGRPGGDDRRGAGEHLVIRKEGRCLPRLRGSGSERIGLGDLLGELLLGGLLGRGGGISHAAGLVACLEERRHLAEYLTVGREDCREPGLRLFGGDFERSDRPFLLGTQGRELLDE